MAKPSTARASPRARSVARKLAMQALYEALTASGIRTTIRRGIIRVSCHFYNNEADVDRLVEAAAQWKTAAAA